ncbi:MAG: folylpolyglutamate synthase/dihydrofolate synthase family protein [Verrucomicrobiota bacterium]
MQELGEAVHFLYGLRQSGVKLGLENMRRLCALYDNPHLGYPVIHIAGTNGKGSVVAMLESVCCSAGIRCAAFTSPHLQVFNERLRVNGIPITDAELVDEVSELRGRLQKLRQQGHECTFFEATNAMAFSYFSKAGVELALVEAGLGGRLDSTNVVDPMISVITSIGLDHQSMLGDTLEKIAAEKAGIIKPGRPVVAGEMTASCFEVIEAKALSGSSPLIRPQKWLNRSTDFTSMTRWIEREETRLEINLPAAAQIRNAATAYCVIEWMQGHGWQIEASDLRWGFQNIRWPARFQRIHRNPDIILDGAHNAAAVADLHQTWREFYANGPETIALGCLKEKLTPEFAGNLVRLVSNAHTVIHLPVEDKRSASCQDIQKALGSHIQINIRSAGIHAVLDQFVNSPSDRRFLIFGSLYLAGQVLSHIDHEDFQPELNG